MTWALEWMSANHPTVGHLVFVIDSQSVLYMTNMLRREWLKALHGTNIQSIARIFSPGHAGVAGNKAADKLAGEAVVKDTMPMDRIEIMEKLVEKLRDEETEKQGIKNIIARMRELGVVRCEGCISNLSGTHRRIQNSEEDKDAEHSHSPLDFG